MLLDAKAHLLQHQAQAAINEKDYPAALILYEQYLSQCAGAENYQQVLADYQTLKAEAAAAIRDQQAAKDCKSALAFAKAYIEADMNHHAIPLLEKIIAEHPDTSFAAEARSKLEKINAP
jgi:outer membrane protein assembly factor BamD (BamD/ComL family)